MREDVGHGEIFGVIASSTSKVSAYHERIKAAVNNKGGSADFSKSLVIMTVQDDIIY